MISDNWMRLNAFLAALSGLALRFFFIFRFPSTDSGDAPFYIELAWNWLRHRVYGAAVNGQIVSLDSRVPGYPAFLAAIFEVAGRSQRAVMLAQAVVDLGTCFLIALIAARLAPATSRRRVAIAALWLAVLCPFTANYTAVVLTETLVTFLMALAILLLLEAIFMEWGKTTTVRAAKFPALSVWFLAGLVVSFGTLVRPETPLLLIAASLFLFGRLLRTMDWAKLLRAGLLLACGFILPLLPWAARNWYVLHEVQILAPRYPEAPGDFAPVGFNAWTATWLWRYGDVYDTLWNLDVAEIPLEKIPPQAFDSVQEQARVATLLEPYNDDLTLSRAQDAAFHEIARERTARHPLRTYLKIPALRSLAMWFTPRVELLPFSGHVWPLREHWENDREDFVVTLTLFFIGCGYVALGLAGAWRSRFSAGWSLLILFAILRTAFFAYFIETPEPRYVLECFPVLIAFAAQVFRLRTARVNYPRLVRDGS